MSLAKSTSRKEMIRKFHALGWEGPVRRRQYDFMVKGKRKQKIPNPHHGQEYGVSLLSDILRQADISHEEWNNA
jgi:predicted RNA binding protein YcfA (HicA-like mRNA interferase family)